MPLLQEKQGQEAALVQERDAARQEARRLAEDLAHAVEASRVRIWVRVL